MIDLGAEGIIPTGGNILHLAEGHSVHQDAYGENKRVSFKGERDRSFLGWGISGAITGILIIYIKYIKPISCSTYGVQATGILLAQILWCTV